MKTETKLFCCANVRTSKLNTLNVKGASVGLPVRQWNPLKHDDVRMSEALKRCEDYRAIKSLDLDHA
jgi:hypothetical protein